MTGEPFNFDGGGITMPRELILEQLQFLSNLQYMLETLAVVSLLNITW